MRRAILATAAIGALLLAAPPGATQDTTLRVIDGDSIVVRGNTIRIMGLDAPELHGACPAEIALAQRARARLQMLLAGPYTIERHGRDRYGRTLARVLDARGRDVAAVLISEGLARAYDGRGPRGGWC
jgi:micrococcal nuclease